MTGTKVLARNHYNQRKEPFRRANQRNSNSKRLRTAVKNIEGRVKNRKIKFKQLILQPKNVQVKENGKSSDGWLCCA